MSDLYKIVVEGTKVRIYLNQQLTDADAMRLLDDYKWKIPRGMGNWCLIIDQKDQKAITPSFRFILRELFQISKEMNVDYIIHIIDSATTSVQVKRIAKSLDLGEKMFGALSEEDAVEIVKSRASLKSQAVLSAGTADSGTSGKRGESSFQITTTQYGIHIAFGEELTLDDAYVFVRDFKAAIPRGLNWYVLADMRRLKLVSQDVSQILNEATDYAEDHGRQFSVQIVESPTTKLQLRRVAREKGQEDHFYLVTSPDEAEKIINQQKLRFGMV